MVRDTLVACLSIPRARLLLDNSGIVISRQFRGRGIFWPTSVSLRSQSRDGVEQKVEQLFHAGRKKIAECMLISMLGVRGPSLPLEYYGCMERALFRFRPWVNPDAAATKFENIEGKACYGRYTYHVSKYLAQGVNVYLHKCLSSHVKPMTSVSLYRGWT